MKKQTYFSVKNNVTNKSITVLAIDKFAAIQRAVEKDNYQYLNSQYEIKKSK